MPTHTMEDYLEKIHLLIEEKGYARVVDIASALNVLPSSVSKMIQKLSDTNYVNYEKYRGMILTAKGKKIASALAEKHSMLEEFLRTIGVDEEFIYQDVEGIEHHISKQTTFCISSLVRFFEDHPHMKESFTKYKNQMEK